MRGGRILWSRAETVLALDVAMSRRLVDARDPAVVDLSRLLRAAAGRHVAPRHRNPHGVACKVARLAAVIGGGAPAGGARLETSVCGEFAGRPEALAAAVAEARLSLAASARLEPSRGPVPAFGAVVALRAYGPTFVYLARLHGALLADGRVLAKVGRSADVARRMDELNGGLPAALGIHWRPVATWGFRDAAGAHVAEQAMLARLGAAGLSAGGEFFATDALGLAEVAAARPELTGRSDPPRSPSARGRRGSRVGRTRGRARRRG